MVAGTMVSASEDFCCWWSLIRGPQCWLVRWSVKTFVGGGRSSEGHSGGWYDGQSLLLCCWSDIVLTVVVCLFLHVLATC